MSGHVQRLTSPEDEMGFTITITVKKIKYTQSTESRGGVVLLGFVLFNRCCVPLQKTDVGMSTARTGSTWLQERWWLGLVV